MTRHVQLWAILSLALLLIPTASDAQDRQKAKQQRQAARQQQQTPPTHADVHYGPNPRQVLDFWQARTEKPAALLVSIHGGGFRGGNKGVQNFSIEELHNRGVSVAAITYRLSGEAIAPAQFEDAARAVQFLRSKAAEWNIDPQRVAATGGSAGAGLSLWLAFHDDMAQPDSPDPIARQSTRLKCAVVYNGQTSYDPRVIRDLFPGTDTYQHPALAQLYDVDLTKLDQLPPEKYKLFELVSPITHLTRDDPPVMLVYSRTPDTEVTNQGTGIHHPKFGLMLKEKMDGLGIPCIVAAGQRQQSPTAMEFLLQHLGTTK
ncbi:MAG: alpha/beta hydrolase fold domain-containing protein [Planctomycetes bacterium]|nr:alpha/beta hydrolase fold domain-containing protein [Planctomycetota bacterium]